MKSIFKSTKILIDDVLSVENLNEYLLTLNNEKLDFQI